MTTPVIAAHLLYCPIKARFQITPHHPKSVIYRIIGKRSTNNEVTFVISRRGPFSTLAVSVFSSRDSAEEFFAKRVRVFAQSAALFLERHRTTLSRIVSDLYVREVYPVTRDPEDWSWANLRQDALEGKVYGLLLASDRYGISCSFYGEEAFNLPVMMLEVNIDHLDNLDQVPRRYYSAIWPILRSLMGLTKVPIIQLETVKC